MKKVFLTEENIWDYADGIDFCVIFSNQVTHSYTREEFKTLKFYPKNNRRYWVVKNNNKTYLELNKEILIDDSRKIYQKI